MAKRLHSIFEARSQEGLQNKKTQYHEQRFR